MAKQPKKIDPNRVEAGPTKDLLIQSLVKDIPLARAIIDLVDNSVDGARGMRGNKDYSGLFVHITISKGAFEITDNCGGIPVETAREYAFRFGRPPNMPSRLRTPHSVGQFGVGMKRAIFKLGRVFFIESTTDTSHFVVQENVDLWKVRKDKDGKEDWPFKFTPPVVEAVKQAEKVKRGTTIRVTKLLPAVAQELNSDKFQNELSSELAAAHEIGLHKKLEIKLNGTAIPYKPSKLYSSKKIQPGKKRISKTEGESKIDIVLYAGICSSKPTKDGGWYVYCNERLILRADQSPITGWEEKAVPKIPKYHPQFSRFRGYLFLDCDNPSVLPWNTTKTGLDTDSELYKGIRREMTLLTRPVIDLLNALNAENRRKGTRPLQTLVEMMDDDEKTHVLLSDIKRIGSFIWPTPKDIEPPDSVEIKYKRSIDKVERLKRFFKVSKPSEVGEKTFDRVYKLEGSD